MKHLNPSALAPPMGKFSHATIIPPGYSIAFVSGQIGVDADGTLTGPDVSGQTRQAFSNLETVIRELGATPSDIVKMLTLVVGPDGFGEFAHARDHVFAQWFPDGIYPAHSAATVTALAAPNLLVEIEAVVVVPQ